MNNNIEIKIVEKDDLEAVRQILLDWLTDEEVEHYMESIQEVVPHHPSKSKFDSHYYVALLDQETVGVSGYRTPNPKLLKFATTKNPAELSMLYVAKQHCGGKGVGTALLQHVLKEVEIQNYEELLVRSGTRFVDTGWGFYDEMGLERVGTLAPPECTKTSQIWTKQICSQAFPKN